MASEMRRFVEEFLPLHKDMLEYLDPAQLRDVLNEDTPYFRTKPDQDGITVWYAGAPRDVSSRSLNDCVSTNCVARARRPAEWAERGRYYGAVVTKEGIAVLTSFSDG